MSMNRTMHGGSIRKQTSRPYRAWPESIHRDRTRRMRAHIVPLSSTYPGFRAEASAVASTRLVSQDCHTGGSGRGYIRAQHLSEEHVNMRSQLQCEPGTFVMEVHSSYFAYARNEFMNRLLPSRCNGYAGHVDRTVSLHSTIHRITRISGPNPITAHSVGRAACLSTQESCSNAETPLTSSFPVSEVAFSKSARPLGDRAAASRRIEGGRHCPGEYSWARLATDKETISDHARCRAAMVTTCSRSHVLAASSVRRCGQVRW